MAGIKMVWTYGAHFSFREGHVISVSLDEVSFSPGMRKACTRILLRFLIIVQTKSFPMLTECMLGAHQLLK